VFRPSVLYATRYRKRDLLSTSPNTKVPSLPGKTRTDRTAQPLSALGSPPNSGTRHLMTGCALAISIPTARRPRAVPPEVCLRSPFTHTYRLSHFRHRPLLSPNPSPTVSRRAVRPHPKSSNSHSKHSGIPDTAPFKRYPNSLGDQQHRSPQPFFASGVPINAYDVINAYALCQPQKGRRLGSAISAVTERYRLKHIYFQPLARTPASPPRTSSLGVVWQVGVLQPAGAVNLRGLATVQAARNAALTRTHRVPSGQNPPKSSETPGTQVRLTMALERLLEQSPYAHGSQGD
jgi:hypothetical protein